MPRVIESIHHIDACITVGKGLYECVFKIRFWMHEDEVEEDYLETRQRCNDAVDKVLEKYYPGIGAGVFAELLTRPGSLYRIDGVNAVEVIPEGGTTGVLIYPEWP